MAGVVLESASANHQADTTRHKSSPGADPGPAVSPGVSRIQQRSCTLEHRMSCLALSYVPSGRNPAFIME
jgi:hypothetical protein